MEAARARARGCSRRAFLSSGVISGVIAGVCPAALEARSETFRTFGSDWKRYADPATEFEVYRLTQPEYSSYLPAYYSRLIARREDFLLFSNDRTGSLQPFLMDLKGGAQHQIAEAEALDRESLSLTSDERSFCFFDGATLKQVNLRTLRQREVYSVPSGWRRCPGISLTGDGQYALFGEGRPPGSRLRAVHLRSGAANTVVQVPFELSHPMARPRRAQILYRQGEKAIWLTNSDGAQNRKLPVAEGRLGPVRWSPDGRTVLYLHFPEETTQLNTLRELTPDQNQDKLISKTSQFVHFGCNGNASVFVGASKNKASPTILLLLRVTHRELTLCEHAASNAADVAPVFSPNSQRIYFESDRHGKPAIYRMAVEKLVESTEETD